MTERSESLHYFIHVPKTAGVTVRRWLAESFSRDEILFVYPGAIAEAPDGHTYSFEHIVEHHEELLPSFRVFFGHYHFSRDWFVRPDCRGLGFVRDPRARVVSWHRYSVREAARLPGPEMAAIAAAVRDERATLPELHESIGLLDIDNAIVRYFAAATDPVGAIGDAHLQRAIDNVERHFDFVGHLDWFETSMARIAEILGRPWAPAAARNVSRGASSADLAADYDADFLAQVTRYDRAFVEWIEHRYFDGIPRRAR